MLLCTHKRLFSTVLYLLLVTLCLSVFTSCKWYIGNPHESDSSSENELSEQTDAIANAIAVALETATENGVLDDEGNPADVSRLVTLVETYGYDSVKLAWLDALYEYYFIGEYKTFVSLANDIVTFLVKYVDAEAVTSRDEVTDVLVYAYAHCVGDKYFAYYTKENFSDYEEDVNATYTGIGVQVLRLDSGYLEIVKVYANTPALEIGIVEGDLLIKIEGEDISSLSLNEATALVRGEEGTYVNITVLRDGEMLDFCVMRKRMTEYTVDFKMLDNGGDKVGYISISEFDDGTFPQFVEAYQTLIAEGATAFVLDVRTNPGGAVLSVSAILEYILPDGVIATMNYKHAMYDYTVSSVFDAMSEGSEKYAEYRAIYDAIAEEEGAGDHVIREPIAVLTNEYTISAAELFSSAIRDYANDGKMNARLFGVKTYGKGTGMTPLPLVGTLEDGTTSYDGSYINMSTFTYDPPNGVNYEGVGVYPHETVTLPDEVANKSLLKLTLEEDTQLQAALVYLKNAE